MKIEGLSAKDQKIYNQNPGASLEDLAAKGLSQKGYSIIAVALSAGESEQVATDGVAAPVATTAAALPPVVQRVEPKMVAPTDSLPKPQLSQSLPASGGRLRYKNKKTGKTGYMNAATINMMAAKYPDEYEILK